MTVAALLDAARARGLTIATAESCTGGMIAAALTDVAGSSDVMMGGIVSYSNAMKIETLDVSAAVLARTGAVSPEIAEAMARGARSVCAADIAVSTTGIAGPGGSDFKPEGRVCFGWATATGTGAETIEFGAIGRGAVRAAATGHALAILVRIVDSFPPKM